MADKSEKPENISMQIDENNSNHYNHNNQQNQKLNTNTNLNCQTNVHHSTNQQDLEYNKKQESRMMNFFNQEFLDRKIDFKPK